MISGRMHYDIHVEAWPICHPHGKFKMHRSMVCAKPSCTQLESPCWELLGIPIQTPRNGSIHSQQGPKQGFRYWAMLQEILSSPLGEMKHSLPGSGTTKAAARILPLHLATVWFWYQFR